MHRPLLRVLIDQGLLVDHEHLHDVLDIEELAQEVLDDQNLAQDVLEDDPATSLISTCPCLRDIAIEICNFQHAKYSSNSIH